MTVQSLDDVRELAQQLRVDSIRCSTAAGSGHPTSSMSAADVMAVLLARYLRYDWEQPDNPASDHLIFSKGHASPLLYSMFKAAGVVSDEELINTYRRFGARLEGHPTPVLPWVDVATGSLGQGLPDGVGVALAGRYLDELPYRVWVLCGDSEMAEGSMWEAFDKAAYYRLDNLTAIVDVNRLGQRGPTELGWDLDAYTKRIEAFGCRAIPIDGHDLEADRQGARVGGRRGPAHGDPGPDPQGQAGSPRSRTARAGTAGRCPPEMAERAITELGGERHLIVQGPRPDGRVAPGRPSGEVSLPRYELGAKVATRLAFGQALAAIGARGDVVALDGEVGNSTHAEEFAKAHPERYFEMFIAEQQLVAAAVGMSVRGYVPFAATFAAFFTRAYDFIRMAAISAGEHPAVRLPRRRRDRRRRPIADGPGRPRDDAGRARLHRLVPQRRHQHGVAWCAEMAGRGGVVYLRTTRGAYPVLYGPDEEFPVGGAKVVRSSPGDQVTLIGAGVTLHDCLAAADELGSDGISARVVDLYSIKPIDTPTLLEAADATGGRLVVAEDHYPEGGIGEAVLEALSDAGHPAQITHLAVRGLPGSGTPAELIEAAGISAGHIAHAARDLLI